MLNSFISGAAHIILACGATDFRKQTESLSAMVSMQLNLDPFESEYVFIFCNKRRNAIKVLRYDKNGFVLATKKLLERMKFQWPKNTSEVAEITPQQLEWLLDGLEIEQKKAHHPAKLIVKQIVRQVAKCSVCGSDGSENPNSHFQKAAVPAKVLQHSIATPSLVAQVMYQKYAMGIPLNRLESDFYRMGLVLSRTNMAHWMIRCSDEWLTPVYNRIHEELLKCEILHMDETRIQVNKESGKKASSDSFMWIMQSGACESIRATFFHYARTCGKSVALELLKGFQGYLTTDAYTAYENLNVEGIEHNFCWSHLRRYYIESIPLDNSGKELKGSKGAEAREYINLLFKLEQEMKSLSCEERKEKRQDVSQAVLDAFWSWVEETAVIPTTNEKLTKTLNYSLNHRKQFETFLKDGRLEISNNLCESHIRPFATARRAWLFADTPDGAKANAVLYTLVESARANELNVYEYLKHILTFMPNADFYNQPEVIDDLLPWSENLPQECRLEQKNKKHFKK